MTTACTIPIYWHIAYFVQHQIISAIYISDIYIKDAKRVQRYPTDLLSTRERRRLCSQLAVGIPYQVCCRVR